MKFRGHLRVQQLYPPTAETHRTVIWVGRIAEINVVTKKTHPPIAGIKSGSSTPYNGHCTDWANDILKTHCTELATEHCTELHTALAQLTTYFAYTALTELTT